MRLLLALWAAGWVLYFLATFDLLGASLGLVGLALWLWSTSAEERSPEAVPPTRCSSDAGSMHVLDEDELQLELELNELLRRQS